MEEKEWNEVHINFAPFKGEEQRYWVVGYNEGGIGTPLFNVDEDVKYFMERAKKEVFDDIEKECPSPIWGMLNKETIIPLKQRHLSTFQGKSNIIADKSNRQNP